MKRRQFLQSGSMMSLPVLLGGLEVSALTGSSLFSLLNNDDDKVLVLIQLNGGNDGLNMVIPLDQYSGLNMVRPNLVLPESSVLKLVDKTGLHPVMTGMHRLYQDENWLWFSLLVIPIRTDHISGLQIYGLRALMLINI